MTTTLIVLYGLSMIGSMVFRYHRGYGPTAAVVVDAFWPFWLPVVLFAEWRKRKAVRQ